MEMLIAEGVQYVFGNPGTSETPIMDSLQDYPQLKYMVALQENSVVAMADGFARATGNPAVVNVHIAGGLAGGLSMLYNAYRGGSPLIVTAGNSDTRMRLTDPVLSGDLVEMTRQYTKWSAEVSHASEVPMAVRRAFKEARTPPMGPVFLSLPWNAMDENAEMEIVPSSQSYYRIRPDSHAVGRAAAILARAEDPVMVVGRRVAQSGALAETVEVAELLGARVFDAAFTEVNFPTSHPQFMGVMDVNPVATRESLAGSDVILAVGADVFATFRYAPEPILSGNAKLVHVDSSAREVEKIYPTAVGVVADPKSALKELALELQQVMSASAREAALTRAASMADEKKRAKTAFQNMVRERWNWKPISPERLMTELAQILPSNAVISDEASTSRPSLWGAFDFDEPGSMYGRQGGSLGWGMAGSVGLQLADPHRPVVAVVGDGSAMYTIQALWTAARYAIPVKWVICNNRTYKVLKVNMDVYLRDMIKDVHRESQYLGMDFPLPLDLAGVAEGFGVHGRRVEDPSELRPALEEALAVDGPALVDVVMDGSTSVQAASPYAH